MTHQPNLNLSLFFIIPETGASGGGSGQVPQALGQLLLIQLELVWQPPSASHLVHSV